MLSFPAGIQRSVNSHNSHTPTFLDWLEASVLFAAEELSQTDVVDVLVEEHIYSSQNYALEFVLHGWGQVKRRLSWMGATSPIGFKDRWMKPQMEWKEVPAHSYCLAVCLGPRYNGWTSSFGTDYTEQGLLFELITKHAMANRFPGWSFLQTGWSRDSTSKLLAVVDSMISALSERKGYGVDDYSSLDANEAGVDLVWHLPFADQRSGNPVYLAQCASGNNWTEKLGQPDMSDWEKIIDFANKPNKAFSLPFALDDRELRWRSNSTGLILDRYRILAHGIPERAWLPADLRERIVTWLEPRLAWISDR